MPSGHFLSQDLADLVLFRIVPVTVPDQFPQDILIIGGDKVFHGPAHQISDIPIQGRMVPGAEGIGPGLHIGPAGIRGFAAVIPHPEEGDHGLGEVFHLLPKVRAQFLALFPVPALHRLHILRGGVIKVRRKVLFLRLGLDLGKDLRLRLGAVGLYGRIILFPQGGQYMAVRVRGRIGIHHRGNQQGNDGRKGCPDISIHKQTFLRSTPFNNCTTKTVFVK